MAAEGWLLFGGVASRKRRKDPKRLWVILHPDLRLYAFDEVSNDVGRTSCDLAYFSLLVRSAFHPFPITPGWFRFDGRRRIGGGH